MPNLNDLNGLLVRSSTTDATIYLVDSGQIREVPDAVFSNLFVPDALIRDDINLAGAATGPALSADAWLGKSDNADPQYLVENGVKRHIPSFEVFAQYQFDFRRLQRSGGNPSMLDRMPTGPDLSMPTANTSAYKFTCVNSTPLPWFFIFNWDDNGKDEAHGSVRLEANSVGSFTLPRAIVPDPGMQCWMQASRVDSGEAYDSDRFTIEADAGQTISRRFELYVRPTTPGGPILYDFR